VSYLVLSASLRTGSRSRILAGAAHARLQALGVDADMLDLRDYELPFCDGDTCYEMPVVQELTRVVRDAEGVLFATPVYNFDASAAAKNLVELTGNAWRGKVVGFLCAAGGPSSYMAVMGLANSLMLDFRCVVLPRFVYAIDADFRGDEIESEPVHERLEEVTATLVRFAGALKE
jgi:NAD(P)H-dependent FMN reductase